MYDYIGPALGPEPLTQELPVYISQCLVEGFKDFITKEDFLNWD